MTRHSDVHDGIAPGGLAVSTAPTGEIITSVIGISMTKTTSTNTGQFNVYCEYAPNYYSSSDATSVTVIADNRPGYLYTVRIDYFTQTA